MLLTLGQENGPRAEFGERDIQQAAQFFGLGRVETVEDLGGAFNLNLKLRTDQGTFVLR